ncbi:MAG TPA: acetyltransferase [Patescibacteria group bacterium]|nr:acetyltransferase [Patescibacteria group bacterium]
MQNKKIVIFGNTKFAEMIRYYIETETDDTIIGYTVDREFIEKSAIEGVELVPFEVIDSLYSKEEVKILPVIGYNRMNNIRKDIFNRIKSKGYEVASFVHHTAKIAQNCKLGEGNIFLENTLVQPFVSIGSGNVFWSNVNISHHTSIGNYNFFAPSASISGNVKIENNCFVGNNSTIKNEVIISDFTLIGAGAYISKNTKEYSIVVPAKSQLLVNKSSMDIDLH